MVIRELTETDVPAFWELRLRALRDHPDAFGMSYEEQRDTPLAAIAERFRTSYSTPSSFILGAFADGLVGMVGCFGERSAKVRHKASLWGVYVAPEARGRGVARALLTAAIDRVRAWPDVDTLRIAVVVGNDAARSLYLSLGFTIYGVEPRALKLPDGYRDEELLSLTLR